MRRIIPFVLPLALIAATAAPKPAFSLPRGDAASSWGIGATTLTCIDFDRDGYGTGPGCKGPDAADNDPTINTVATWKAKYASLAALLKARGYTGILRYWFVDYANGNDATCVSGTSAAAEANPCKTWGHFGSLLLPGDAVVFRGGKTPAGTRLPQRKSGTATNPILLIGYPGELFTLDRTGTGDGISGINLSNLIIDGFKIYDSGNLGTGIVINTNPRNITIRNMETHGNYTGLRMFDGIQDVLVEHNVFHDTRQTEGVYFGSRGRPSNNLTFRNNILYNISGLGSGYPAVQYNGRITRYIVEGNIVYGAEQCFSWLEGVSNSVFRNNVCFGNAKALLTIYNYPGNQRPDCTCPAIGICPYDQINNVIENNTLVRPRYNRVGTAVSLNAAFVVNNSSYCTRGDLGHNTWRNNLVYGYGNQALMQYYNADAVAKGYIATSSYQNNLWYKAGSSVPTAIFRVGSADYTLQTFAPLAAAFAGNIVADPLFKAYDEANWAAPSRNDFHLQAGSPALNSGGRFGLSTDIQGRRQPAVPTIGAYAH